MATGQQISNGRYKLTCLGGGGILRQDKGGKAILSSPADDDGERWDVAFDGQGGYTLRNVATGLYLGSKTDPSTMAAMLEGVSEPFAWKVGPGNYPGTITLSPAANGAMALGPSLLKIYPPPAGWAPKELNPDLCWELASA
jgi:hypothetical protein